MKELAIGEEIRIRCVKGSRCSDCMFKDYDNCGDIPCTKNEREDGKNVHFEIVED